MSNCWRCGKYLSPSASHCPKCMEPDPIAQDEVRFYNYINCPKCQNEIRIHNVPYGYPTYQCEKCYEIIPETSRIGGDIIVNVKKTKLEEFSGSISYILVFFFICSLILSLLAHYCGPFFSSTIGIILISVIFFVLSFVPSLKYDLRNKKNRIVIQINTRVY